MHGPDTGRVPPHDDEAERAVLSACLLSGEALDEAAELLGPDDWYRPAHVALWDAMLALRARGEPVDVITLHGELAARGVLERLGGASGLAQLSEVMGTTANTGFYVQRVKALAAKRKLVLAGAKIQQIAFELSLGLEDTIAQAEAQLLEAIGSSRPGARVGTIADALGDMLAHMREIETGQATLGFETGMADLDDLLCGLRPGEMSGVAGRPSAGKSTFTVGLLQRLAERGVPCGLVSLEMGRRDLAYNLTSSRSGVEGTRLRRVVGLSEGERRRVLEAADELSRLPVLIDDGPTGPLPAVLSRMRSMIRRHGCQVVALDYLQMIETPDGRTRYEEISRASTQLKKLARETGAHVVVVLQMNRANESRREREPMLSDLRDSGQIEQDLDVAMLLHRPGYYAPDDPSVDQRELQVRVAKNRNGPTGAAKLTYRRECFRFEDYEPPADLPPPRPRRRLRGRSHPGVDE